MDSARTEGDSESEQLPRLVRETLDLIAGKWVPAIFYALFAAGGPLRYGELRRRLAPITPKELAKQLRHLEAAGLVSRTVYPTAPPQVEYRLTDLGESLHPRLQSLVEWAAEFGEVVARRQLEAHAASRPDAPLA